MIRKISCAMAMMVVIAGLSGCSSTPANKDEKADLGVSADNELLGIFPVSVS
jgi:hypothetical protein